MSDNIGDEALLTPGAAASRLGVSGAALRRMAVSYAAVHGPLPEGAQGRLWPAVAVERLHDARQLTAANRAKSVQAALELLQAGGATLPDEAAVVVGRGIAAPGELLAELRALRGEVEAMRGELAELRAEVAASRALPKAERAAAVEGGGGGVNGPGAAPGAAERSADGPMVRAVRWLERLLRGGR